MCFLNVLRVLTCLFWRPQRWLLSKLSVQVASKSQTASRCCLSQRCELFSFRVLSCDSLASSFITNIWRELGLRGTFGHTTLWSSVSEVHLVVKRLEAVFQSLVFDVPGGCEPAGGGSEPDSVSTGRPHLRGASRVEAASADRLHWGSAQRLCGPAAELVSPT